MKWTLEKISIILITECCQVEKEAQGKTLGKTQPHLMEIEIYANPSQTILNCVRSAAVLLCEEVLCKRADRDFFL